MAGAVRREEVSQLWAKESEAVGVETGIALKERKTVSGAVSESLSLGDVETQLWSQVRQKAPYRS